MAAYCPACLDVWAIRLPKFVHRDWDNIRPGIHMHVNCGRALQAIRGTRR